MTRLVLLLVLLPIAALAQASGTPAVVPPSATGLMHACAMYYPPKAVRLNEEGTTTLSFTIAIDGSVQGIAVAESSGFDDLDQASITCARQWKYKPAMKDGTPVAVPWKAKVTRALSSPKDLDLPRPSVGNSDCSAHRSDPSDEDGPGVAIVAFGVDTDGSVFDATVTQSSGDGTYDNYALSCVSGWKFTPAKRNGEPVKVYMTQNIFWSRH